MHYRVFNPLEINVVHRSNPLLIIIVCSINIYIPVMTNALPSVQPTGDQCCT